MCEILKKRVKVFLREKARECCFKYMSVRENVWISMFEKERKRERERERERE